MKDSASKLKHDNATDMMILVKKDNRQGNLEGLGNLSYTQIKAYCTAVLGCQDLDCLRVEEKGQIGIRYCIIG